MFTKYPDTMYTYPFSWRSYFMSSNYQSIFKNDPIISLQTQRENMMNLFENHIPLEKIKQN